MKVVETVMNLALGSSWRTSLFGLGAGVLTYFASVAGPLPHTPAEWRAAAMSALFFAWGRVQKDSNVSNAPRPDEAKPVK